MVRLSSALCGVLVLAAVTMAHGAGRLGPVELRVDNLSTPLGIDDGTPSFSWQLQDDARGARQSAYEVQVAASAAALANGQTLWDSGQIASPQSINVRYAGAALKPGTRYFWRVKVWDVAGKPYAPSAPSWWETGLLSQDNWHAAWIGYETPEEAAVRHASAEWITSADAAGLSDDRGTEERIAYRAHVQLAKAIRGATLYAACEDTVSAWVNGQQALTANPLPPYKQMPWKKYVQASAGAALEQGENTIAIECVHYVVNPGGNVHSEASPMSATLYVQYKDGSEDTFVSGTEWKSAVHASAGWQAKAFDDSSWKPAVKWGEGAGWNGTTAGNPWIPDSVKALRHSFEISRQVRSARLYATALGMYEAFLNGKRVSEDMLAPGWTDYRERVLYQTYDVTALLAKGQNAIGALLAPGWYSTPLEWFQQPNNYGDTPPAFRAQLRIEYTDGSVEWVNTDNDWKADRSFILSSELYDGERQDARLKQTGWDTATFDASAWKPASVIEPKPVRIEAQSFPPVRAERIVAAISRTEPKPGVYVYDFGQNLAGVERVQLEGAAGTDVRLRFAEILNDDGTLYVENLRTAKATDHFILDGKGVEEFMPQFTFHGFRYMEITGLSSPPGKENVGAVVLHTAAPFDVKLKTGSAMINKLWSNILWGQRSNFLSVPTDCPQRDERLGWMADAQVFWRTASYNMDLAAFSRKFAADMRGTQAGTPFYGIFAPGTVASTSDSGAGWSDAGVIIPWTSWLQTGDTRVIVQNWDAMEKYLNAIETANPDGLWKNQSGIPFGDWLSPEGKTDQVLIATAYWAYDVTLMREMAHALGRTDDEQQYQALFEKIKAAFEKQFVHSDGFVAGADNSASPFGQINNPNAKSTGGDTQTGYVLALHMNLLPEALRQAAAEHLVDKIERNHGLLGTGFLGTPYLLEELTETGHADVAYQLLLNTRYPSWGYLVEHGATTMWERWNGDQMKSDPSMNSYNHYAYGAVADWIYRYAAGVDTTPLDAGFHTVLLHSAIDARLGSLSFDYNSSYGPIHSDWTAQGETATWHLQLPANTNGWVSAEEAGSLRINGSMLSKSSQVKPCTLAGRSGFEIPAGSYTLEVQIKSR